MPKTIFSKPDLNVSLRTILRGAAVDKGKNFADLGKMIGCSSKTVTARFKCPDNFTMGELRALRSGLDIDADEFRAAIKF